MVQKMNNREMGEEEKTEEMKSSCVPLKKAFSLRTIVNTKTLKILILTQEFSDCFD